MTLSVLHTTQSTKPATADPADIDGPNWNEEHAITLTAGTLLGAWTSGTGAAAEVTLGDNLSMSAAGVLSASLGSGAISAVGTPVDGQIGVWTSATGLEGTSALTWSGTVLTVTGQIAGVTSFDATTQATIDAGVTITESQISDLGTYLTGITGESLGSLSDVSLSSPTTTQYLSYNGSNWVNRSPLFADITDNIGDAQVPESAVTQHEAALAIVPANANNGSGASATTYWRGDGVWAATDTGADVAATAANVLLTNADVVSTNADAASTAADAISTAADVVSTAALYDAFDDRYLGAFSTVSEPTVDNDGDPLAVGAIYWNTTENDLRFWTGSVWSSPEANTAADVVSTNADVVLTNADVVLTNADVVSTNADVVSTNADAATTAQDAIDTAADVIASAASAAAALASENNAATSETNASNSASAASTSASNASASEIAAAASYDSFDDRYLGSKGSAPTLDNDGAALLTGALYFDTVSESMWVYSGTAWVEIVGVGFTWQSAWTTTTAYVVNDTVENNGSSYVCILGHTSASTDEPGVGVNEATYWDLVAAKGADGAGSGDVVGPVSATDNAVARFDTTTGELIQDSVVIISDTGAVTGVTTVDGRDLATDGSKLDGIEAGADVTDAGNVDAAGAVMESDFTPAFSLIAQQSGTGSPSMVSLGTDEILGRVTGGGTLIEGLTATQVRSLINVEDGADVTDATNVNAAGAVMESDFTGDSTFLVGTGVGTVAIESAATARTSLGVDAAGTDNSTDVTLAGTPDYITLSGQVITRNQIDLTADVTGVLPEANLPNASTTAEGVVELATTAEINTGTDAARVLTPDQFAVSNLATFVLSIVLFNPAEDVVTGDAAATFTVPACMAGLNVISARADHETAGTTGTTTITIRNVTQGADILSTGITISAGATTASDGTISLTEDDLTSGDRLDFNVDTVTSVVAPQGLLVTLECRLP